MKRVPGFAARRTLHRVRSRAARPAWRRRAGGRRAHSGAGRASSRRCRPRSRPRFPRRGSRTRGRASVPGPGGAVPEPDDLLLASFARRGGGPGRGRRLRGARRRDRHRPQARGRAGDRVRLPLPPSVREPAPRRHEEERRRVAPALDRARPAALRPERRPLDLRSTSGISKRPVPLRRPPPGGLPDAPPRRLGVERDLRVPPREGEARAHVLRLPAPRVRERVGRSERDRAPPRGGYVHQSRAAGALPQLHAPDLLRLRREPFPDRVRYAGGGVERGSGRRGLAYWGLVHQPSFAPDVEKLRERQKSVDAWLLDPVEVIRRRYPDATRVRVGARMPGVCVVFFERPNNCHAHALLYQPLREWEGRNPSGRSRRCAARGSSRSSASRSRRSVKLV